MAEARAEAAEARAAQLEAEGKAAAAQAAQIAAEGEAVDVYLELMELKATAGPPAAASPSKEVSALRVERDAALAEAVGLKAEVNTLKAEVETLHEHLTDRVRERDLFKYEVGRQKEVIARLEAQLAAPPPVPTPATVVWTDADRDRERRRKLEKR